LSDLLDWTLQGQGYGTHVSSVVIFAILLIWILWYCWKNRFPWSITVLWAYGVIMCAITTFETLWHISVGVTHGGEIGILWIPLYVIQLTGVPIVAYFQGKLNITMRWDGIFEILMGIAGVIYLIWFFAPFPHEVVASPYFPQTVYGNGIYVPNIYVRILNISLKATLSTAIVYLLLGERTNA